MKGVVTIQEMGPQGPTGLIYHSWPYNSQGEFDIALREATIKYDVLKESHTHVKLAVVNEQSD